MNPIPHADDPVVREYLNLTRQNDFHLQQYEQLQNQIARLEAQLPEAIVQQVRDLSDKIERLDTENTDLETHQLLALQLYIAQTIYSSMIAKHGTQYPTQQACFW